jgi:hypothetical protein
MGTIITDSTCEGVTLEWRQNGPDAVPIPGLYVVITTPSGEIGPLPTKGIIDVEPNADYVVEYILTDGHADGRDMIWGTHPVTTPGLPTDCGVDTTVATLPTTTPSPAPTAPPEVTESTTALAPPSTIATAIDMDVDPCVTSATGCTVAVGVPPTLPATGLDGGGVLLVGGTVVLVAGAIFTLVTRRRGGTS